MSAAVGEPAFAIGEVSRPRPVREAIRRNPAAIAGLVVVLIFVVVAIFAPVLAPYPTSERVGEVYEAPSQSHPLGLNDGGIDMLSLLIWGSRVSLLVGFASAGIAALVGSSVGIVAGYYGGVRDTTLMRITDIFMVIPEVPLMLVVAALWGASLQNTILIIGLLFWTWMARIIRSQVKSLRSRPHIKRLRALGASDRRIIFRHVIPYVAPLIVANVVLTIAVAIFAETALAFLGLSDPGQISLGGILRAAFERTAISAEAWWAVVPPGVCIAAVILACTLVGRAVEDSLNPRLRVSHLGGRGFKVLRRSPVSDLETP